MTTATTTSAKTMTVTVRDRSAEPAWGSGPLHVATRPVTIPNACPQCGGRRGEPRNLNSYEDGVWFSVDVWTNPCGHIDMYAAVIAEALELGSLGQVTLR